ncbi:MAG: TolC family protein [Sphingobacteriales bacterium]|nr:TolC family protein [Sphingobacteriales bacterium]
MNTRKSIFTALFFCIALSVYAQDTRWDLRKCVEYAMSNNVSVKQADVQARFAELTSKQSKWQQQPNLNFTNSTGYQFGRSIDPTTNLFTTQQQLFQNYNLNANVTIFNWNRIKYDILSNKYNVKAALTDVEKTKNDIALAVATSFLQTLLTKEQVNIAEVQVSQTLAQLTNTRRKVNAGTLPELNALELEAQLARDSSTLVSAQTNEQLNLLQLKAQMNLDAATPFDTYIAFIDKIPVYTLGDMQPDAVYKQALTTQPAQQANELRLKALNAAFKSVTALKYPTLTGFAGLNTRFANANKYKIALPTGLFSPTSLKADVSGTLYDVKQPDFSLSTRKNAFFEQWDGWGTQLNRNFGQNIGIQISIPILNGGQTRSQIERAKLNLQNLALTKEQSDTKLKQDIYQAYQAAVAALEKFNANKKAVDVAQRTYDLSVKRYELGLLSTLDLITNQNNLLKAKLDLATSHYDYIFKMKVLEFYKGQGLRLE